MPTKRETGFYSIQATAENLDGFTVRSDFDDMVEYYLRKQTVLWQMIQKKTARADVVKKIREGALPTTGFVNKSDLSNATTATGSNGFNNPMSAVQNDLSDPGQEVKALSGAIGFSHYARSLSTAQGQPYGDRVAEETDDLLSAISIRLEQSLISGDKNGNALEFDGIINLGHPSQVYTADLIGTQPDGNGETDSLVTKICEVVARMTTDRQILRQPTHLLMSGATQFLLIQEIGMNVLNMNVSEIVPGVQVPQIQTNVGALPIISLPWILDLDGGAGSDVMRIYLVDINSLEWHGVPPFGGSNSLDPQVFDVTRYMSGDPLLDTRMALIYGCLYAKNQGHGISRIDVTAPSGSAWNV